MSKNLTKLIPLFFVVGIVTPGVSSAPSKAPKPLTDGLPLAGVDGKLINADINELHQNRQVDLDSQNGWFFKLESDFIGDKGIIKAGSTIEILYSMTLEEMIADVQDRTAANYRLWGRITQYRGRNFIFPEYFLALGKIHQQQPEAPQELEHQSNKPTINEPNDFLTIPDGIVEKLKTRKTIPPQQPVKPSATQVQLKQDFILIDRTAVLVEQAEGYSLFALDAFGRNVSQKKLKLLPCQALELVQMQQSVEPEQLRFKIAGRVTEYKGEYYLLLQRAIRVYSHGNFGR
jgi:hypothetical protein